MKKYLPHALSVVCVAAVLAFAWVFSFPLLKNDCGYDKEAFRYMGMLIANGALPYVDGFDHKPPLLYFFNAFVHGWDPYGQWLLETFLLAASALALLFTAAKRRWPLPVLYPVYFIALLRDTTFVGSGGLTRSYGATFTLLAMCTALLELPFASLILGLLFGTCFFLQQNDAMPLLLLWAYYLLRRKNLVKELALFASGGVAVAAPIFFWFWWKGAFQEFIYQAFLFNTRLYVSDHVFSSLPGRFKKTVNDFGFRHWFLVVAILFALLPRRIFWNRRELPRSALTFALLGLVAEIVMMNISGVLYQTYFLGLLAWIVLVTGELFRMYSAHEVIPRRFTWFLLFATLYALPNPNLSRAWKEGTAAIREGWETKSCGSDIEKFTREVAGQKGQFYPFGDMIHVSQNRHWNIQMPNIWIYIHFWNQLPRARWDDDRAEFRKILNGLDFYQTKYIYSAYGPGNNPFLEADLNELWFAYMAKHYVRAEGNVWRRK